ncbi:MAG: 4-hydroxy-tetrahydrodipicolinate reductase [Oscillospiraceae bacterium]|nr:4-hydroxy-tetrahydrodipicolinate reductase [Oscillospiraceae bacterium]
MLNILVHGASGRMGQMVCRILQNETPDMVLAAQVSPDLAENAEKGIFASLEQNTVLADCVIDFSHHTAAPNLAAYCAEHKLPLVVGTTAHTEAELAAIKDAAKTVPVFRSANMSIGVAFLAEIGKRAAALFPNADIEIIEKHHNQKLDVPSGTALLLADRISEARSDAEYVIGRHENGKRKPQEIGIHSLRLGSEVGSHEIIIATGAETLTLRHDAEDRRLFAEGALAAARFIVKQKAGLYDMRDMLTKEASL